MHLKHLSLFSGIGGIDLAAEAAGFRTVGMVEIGEFQRKVLRERFPTAELWGDIGEVTADDVFRRTGCSRIHLLSGGYPCQPFSSQGTRKGTKDQRHLWPAMLRIIRGIKPDWVLAENVMGHVARGLDEVLDDLATEDYSARAIVLPASAFGAPHLRYRVFVVAHSNSAGLPEWPGTDQLQDDVRPERPAERAEQSRSGESLGPGQSRLGPNDDGVSVRLDCHRWPAGQRAEQHAWEPQRTASANRAYRKDRMIALGNAVVPQQVYPIVAGIAMLLREKVSA